MLYKKDLIDFLEDGSFSAPNRLDDKILGFVKKDLIPNHKLIFLKLFSVQFLVGIIVLLFCPQFNFSLTGNYELFHFFHRTFGYYGCNAICGGIFLGNGLFWANFFLKRAEITAIEKAKSWYIIGLSTSFIILFLFISSEIYFDLIITWFLGSSIIGLVTFELGRILKSYLFHHEPIR